MSTRVYIRRALFGVAYIIDRVQAHGSYFLIRARMKVERAAWKT